MAEQHIGINSASIRRCW